MGFSGPMIERIATPDLVAEASVSGADIDLAQKTLGRYQIEKVIGKGATGIVYLGRDMHSGRVVAIKTLALAR
jgi:serine/threonine protein kinase